MDTAVQVAHQILRRAPARQFNPYNDDSDVAHREAIQVLARSGKLQELIGRVEAQLKASPNSVQLLRTLADYHKAAGEADKAKAVYERIAKLRPDDAQLRYQIAMQLVQSGDPAASLPHFKAAIAKEPSLFGYRYWEIQNVFQQAGKTDELAQIFEEVDIKKLGNFWSVEQLVSTLMQNEKSRDRGLRLFRRMWKAFPQERGMLLDSFYSDEVWKLAEMYDYAREAVIPTSEQRQLDPWAGINRIHSWSGGGHVNGVSERLLNAAARQNKLEALRKEIEEAVRRVPEWSGGKALLALIDVRRGKIDEAKKALEALLADDTRDKSPIPHDARLLIGQELENYGPLQSITLTLYERADKEDPNNGLDFEFHPARRLIAMYRKAGRLADARDLVLRYARKPDTNNWGDPGYAAYRRIESSLSIGQELINLGFPADAVPLFDRVLSDTDNLNMARRFGNQDYILNRLRNGLNQGLQGLNDKTLAPTVRALLRPAGGGNGPALDLVLLVHPREVDHAAVTSLFAEAVRKASRRPELRSEIRSALAGLMDKYPKDLSVHVAAALSVASEEKPEALAEAAGRLVRLADETPLEDLSDGDRPNARQRAEAAKQLGLWLVARECWNRDATRKAGDALAARALEAARRQADPLWALAMLRELGQAALDRGDRQTAERSWTQMLELALANPTAAKAKPAAGKPATNRPTAGPATTLDRFDLAAQLAKLAAGHDMVPLSLRAVREALGGGPPVVPMPIESNQGGMIVRRNNEDQQDQTSPKVEQRLAELDRLWRQHKAPAADVYEALRDAVLPATRPDEVFLYPRPLASSVRRPRSAGVLLAEWAARAGRAEELRKRVESRHVQATAEVPAQVLLAGLGLASKDWGLVNRSLEALERRLQKDSLQNSATLACLAALPALDVPEAAGPAIALLERAVKNLASSPGTEPLAGLRLALAHAHFAAGRDAEGRKQVQEYQGVLLRNMPNYGGDYGLYVRKQNLQKVASEYARAGQWAETLDILGQFVDAPAYSQGDPGLGNVITRLAHRFSSLPARERYDRLKAWTMPAANRKSVRLLASFVPEDTPPEVFGKFASPAFEAGVASTAGMLIASAREAGTLDELATEVAKLADQKVENAEALLVLVRVAQGQGATVRKRLEPRLAELQKIATTEATRSKAVLWSDLLAARAALADPALRDLGEAMARALIGQSQRTQNWSFLVHLRRDLADGLVARAGDKATAAGNDPGLVSWHPATIVDANTHAAGAPPGWWVEHDGLIRLVTGTQDQLLLFDYPLTGRFEFSVDAYSGGWAEGHAGYGGLIFEANSNGVPSGIFPVGRSERVPLLSKFCAHESFNRMTIRVEPGKVRYLVNGHLFYEDNDPSPTSPWLTLFTSRERQTAYRNLALTGSPQIPREVPLTHGDRLEGWVTNFLNESQPPRRSLDPSDPRRQALASAGALDDYDWAARDGVLHGRRGEPWSGNAAVQGRIYYHRPLRDGESISYEFYYEPDAVMVHPSLDRLAFLLEPDGVRLHWITDGLDVEWTGLSTDNVADEPSRRGPARLPLRPGAWNAAKLTVAGGAAVLELNGVEVYRRPLEPSNGRQFGFYHVKDRTAARARNVVLRGPWPTSLPVADLASRRESKPGP
jgi:tetratricopeptide (TPR) repeat protein